MSTINSDVIKCDLCQRQYNIDVYQRHRIENQCIKRNHPRLPFQSIKQRSIQIGDRVYSVQRKSQQQQKNEDVKTLNNRENRKQQISTNNNNRKYQERVPNNRRQQAKQLLEKRTKYQPPWIQKRSNSIKDHPSKQNLVVLQSKNSSPRIIDQRILSKKLLSNERPPPPTTKFKNDDLPIKISDRRKHDIINDSPRHQPIFTSKNPTFSRELTNSASRPVRKANTWTRSSKQSANRDGISPIQIPTYCDTSSGPSHDRIILPSNQNYNDDDEFERYSPTPPSTPKYQIDKIQLPLEKQQTMIRPSTYHKVKRSDILSDLFQPGYTPSQNRQSVIHLPPINLKMKHVPILHPRPWR